MRGHHIGLDKESCGGEIEISAFGIKLNLYKPTILQLGIYDLQDR